MKRSVLFCSTILLAIAVWGCDTGDPGVQSTSGTADAQFLSGGDMTVLSSTSFAYMLPAPNISNLDLHLKGDVVFETNRVSAGALFGGLGPVYNSFSCLSCHGNDGRTEPTFRTEGGSGNGESNFLIFIRTPDGELLPGFGKTIHDQAIFGYKPDARVQVSYSIETHSFEDGETYQLERPHYTFSDWYTGSAPEFVFSPRIPLRLVGLGLILAIPDETIEALAQQQALDESDNITGKPQYVLDRNNVRRVGKIDHKAENVDLTVEFAYYSDMGVTNSRFTTESYALQSPSVADSILYHGAEISDKDMNAVDYYLHTLGVPARRNALDAIVQRGQELFSQAGCATCHVPELQTTPSPMYTIGGTPVPEVVNQTIHPYSDFLLHDMGDGLADGFPVGEATGNEWRTTPLWGIGLQSVVNGHSYYLHDGRARSLMEAIMWHGGEAESSADYVRALPKDDRNALIQFLESL